MARRAAKIDANQPEIVAAFRRMGATVDITSALGDGFPDIVVNKFGLSVKVEIKDGEKPPSEQKLTPAEEEHHAKCKGAIAIISKVRQCAGLLQQMMIQSELIARGKNVT